jgi:hypothetical protein
MAVLLIKCPHTDRPISAGIEVDVETFAHLPDVLSHVKCSECGLEHAWWTREAWPRLLVLGERPLRFRSRMKGLCRDDHNSRKDHRSSHKGRHSRRMAGSSRMGDSRSRSRRTGSRSHKHKDRRVVSSSDALLAEPYRRLFHRSGRRVSRL